jgi:DNA-directed RNA polymerase specialized sigma24 family protein
MRDPSPSPHKCAEAAMLSEDIKRAMRYLTDDQACVVLMRMEDYSFEEIANYLDKTEGAVKALKHRGEASLRAVLSKAYADDAYALQAA